MIRDEISASLADLARAVCAGRAAVDADDNVQGLLVTVGEALRLRVELPGAVRRWAGELDDHALNNATVRAASLLLGALDEGPGCLTREYERARSYRVGLGLAARARDVLPSTFDPGDVLERAILRAGAAMDTVDADTARRAIGNRIDLRGVREYLDTLRP